jgi:DNA-directed RNA polymerase subunit RPC12/RpoP
VDINIRKDEILQELYKDYDLVDLNSNDKYQLEELAIATAQSEALNRRWQEEIEKENMDPMDLKRIQSILAKSRSDIISLQKDLKIARKDRGSLSDSPVDFISDLKSRAKSFLKERLSYIYCPECGTLSANIWLKNYNKGSKFQFICPRCDYKFIVNDFDLEDRTNDDSKVVPTRITKENIEDG